jgi:hypothetical protein
MIIKLYLMDVWKLDNSRRIIVRDGNDFNKFCMISCGTAESSKPMTDKEIYNYLVYGENPLKDKDPERRPLFIREFNLREKFEKELTEFGRFVNLVVWSEDVFDEDVLKLWENTSGAL